MSDVVFTGPAVDDLRRIGPDAVTKVRNTWRVVYRISEDKSVEICEVRAVGERADAEGYAEATARAREADRLIYTVGMAREDVAALDLREAVDMWAEYRSQPH
ncbi:hypothetical protein ABZ907_19620 [Nonomuraea wenchangensis]